MHTTAGIDRAVEQLLHRDRQVVLAGLILITGLAWLYLYNLTVQMDMGSMELGLAGTTALPMSDASRPLFSHVYIVRRPHQKTSKTYVRFRPLCTDSVPQ